MLQRPGNLERNNGSFGPVLGKEIIVSKVNFDVLTLAGLSGCGKTTVADLLQQRLGIGLVNFGQQMRKKQLEETGEVMVAHYRRGITFDLAMDRGIMNEMRHARDAHAPILAEARLGAHLAHMLYREEVGYHNKPPRTVSIVLTVVNEQTRLQRVWLAVNEKLKETHAKKIAELRLQGREEIIPLRLLSYEDITRDTKQREIDDIVQWDKTYPGIFHVPDVINPELVHVTDPFDPHFTDELGNRLYQMEISTETRSALEVADAIINALYLTGNIDLHQKSQLSLRR